MVTDAFSDLFLSLMIELSKEATGGYILICKTGLFKVEIVDLEAIRKSSRCR